jgi:four helix bundle protein
MSDRYEGLKVWQMSIELANEVYRATRGFPRDEQFGMTSQMRRAAVSVPSNIAEGQGRISSGEMVQFLGHARGSLFELSTQLRIAQSLGYLPPDAGVDLRARTETVARLLNGLIGSARRRLAKQIDI